MTTAMAFPRAGTGAMGFYRNDDDDDDYNAPFPEKERRETQKRKDGKKLEKLSDPEKGDGRIVNVRPSSSLLNSGSNSAFYYIPLRCIHRTAWERSIGFSNIVKRRTGHCYTIALAKSVAIQSLPLSASQSLDTVYGVRCSGKKGGSKTVFWGYHDHIY